MTEDMFQKPIGELDGIVIIGGYNHDRLDPNWYGRPQSIHYAWRDVGEISIHFDGVDPFIYLPHDRGDGISLDALRDLRELVASDVLERLVAIARQHIAGPRINVPLLPRRVL